MAGGSLEGQEVSVYVYENLVSCCCHDETSRVFVQTWETLDDKDDDQTQESFCPAASFFSP